MRKRERAVVTDDEHWLFFEKECSISLHVLLHLEPQEFQILSYLYKHRGRVVRFQEMYEQIWGLRPDCDRPEDITLTVRISQLRKKTAPFGLIIETIQSIGWKLIF